jgi:hypothetical protein
LAPFWAVFPYSRERHDVRWQARLRAGDAFVAEPQTNGVAERFNRTLKE